MRITIVESPYTTPVADRLSCVRYALWACFDCIAAGEAPFASHLLFTQMLPETAGARAMGLQMRDRMATATGGLIAHYTDLGITPGMLRDVDCTAVVEKRTLKGLVGAAWKRWEWPNASVRLEVL